jgi:hypothetical protein
MYYEYYKVLRKWSNPNPVLSEAISTEEFRDLRRKQ